MNKVLFMEGAPAPYRVDFWNELGKRVDLTVWFEAGHEKGRAWKVDGLGQHFRFEVMPGIRLGEDKYLNPSVIRRLRRERFDAYILCLNSSPTEILAVQWLRKHRIPFIFKSDGGFPRHTGNLLKERLKFWLFPRADLWLSAGSNSTKYLTYYGARPEGIIEYPCSIQHDPEDLRTFSAAERDEFKKREGLRGVVILDASQFVPRKGIDVLIEAYRRIASENTTLVLIGKGPEEARFQGMVQKYNIPNVVFRSFLPREEFLKFYRAADIFAFPTRYDVYGLVINEAMMFGLPVISSDMAGAAHDLIRDGENGFMVPVDNVEQLAGRLHVLVEDAELRVRFGQRSRELIAEYTLPRMADRFVEAIERAKQLAARASDRSDRSDG